MEINHVEQRACIKIAVLRGKDAMECHSELVDALGKNALTYRTVAWPNKIKTTDIELSITVTDDKPIYHSPRRLPFTERDIGDKQIDEWIQNGVIEPCSSAYASQVLVVRKKTAVHDFDVKQKASFDELKRLLCQKPVLGIYRQNCETEIHTDASIDGLAAVLLQRFPDDNSLHPIYYMSRKTSETERKYTSYELEVLAIIEALKKFKVYILGMPFKKITDCDAFTKTMSLPRANGQVERINRTIIPVLSKMSEDDPHEMVQTCSFTTRSLKLNIPTKH
ncbi:pro-Pol polyprotein [Trichonephila clavipes]|nr:pro-Pol polyprotein [Trichonephila clavipes]